MLRLRRSFRTFALWAAVFQLALPPTLAFADAILQRTDGTASMVHIEDHGHKGCHPGHPDNCVLCQTLAHWSAPVPSDGGLLPAAGLAPMVPGAVADCTIRTPYGTPHSRGPPA